MKVSAEIGKFTYKYQVFWDGNYKIAHALKIEPLKTKLEDVLVQFYRLVNLS